MNRKTRITGLTSAFTASAVVLSLVACAQNEDKAQSTVTQRVLTVDIQEAPQSEFGFSEAMADAEYTMAPPPPAPVMMPQYQNGERYDGEDISAIQLVSEAPVSTFSVDVDTGAYANVRRFLSKGQLPPQAALRT